MSYAQPLCEQLEAIAGRIHSLAFDAADERRSTAASDTLRDDIERTAEDLRATVRGSRR